MNLRLTVVVAALGTLLAHTVFGQGANGSEGASRPVVEFKVEKILPRVDQAPALTAPVSVWVHFPLILRRAGIETGSVKARLTVEPDGRVSHVTLITASAHEFAESVFKGGKRCTYVPAKLKGRPVRCEIEGEFIFRLE